MSARQTQEPDAKVQPETRGLKDSITNHFPVVGIGASAGGLEAFTELLKNLPLDTGMVFVLVQHLAPQHESALADLLTRATSMPAREVTNNLPVEANHVYVIPLNKNLGITHGVLKLQPRPSKRARRLVPSNSFLNRWCRTSGSGPSVWSVGDGNRSNAGTRGHQGRGRDYVRAGRFGPLRFDAAERSMAEECAIFCSSLAREVT